VEVTVFAMVGFISILFQIVIQIIIIWFIFLVSFREISMFYNCEFISFRL